MATKVQAIQEESVKEITTCSSLAHDPCTKMTRVLAGDLSETWCVSTQILRPGRISTSPIPGVDAFR